jgi:hypothetical protein
MASENRPGVVVVQELRETPAAVAAPTLNPVVVAPCFQIIRAVDSSGAVNGDAEYATQRYVQAAVAVTQAEFPDPRNNIDEVNIDETQVGARLLYAGALTTLPRGSHGSTGSAFLGAANYARRAVVVFDSGSTTFDFGGTTRLLNIKANSPTDTSPTVVSFTGVMSAAAVAAALSSVPGIIATAYTDLSDFNSDLSSDAGVVVQSRAFGASSSISITGSALPLLTAGESSALVAATLYRVEGSGFRGQDDLDGDLTTPWIEFHIGAVPSGPFYLENKSGALFSSAASSLVFTGAGASIPLRAATATTPGDEFWADGAQVAGAVITAVESSRFKLGILDSARSTFDADGALTSAVYSTVEIATPSALVPFSPVFAYFIANNLVWGAVTPEPEAAALTGDDSQAIDALPAQLMGSAFSATIPVLTGGTISFRIIEDGVTLDDVTHTFTAAEADDLADAVASLNANASLSALTFSLGEVGSSRILMISTVKSGADQGVTILSGSSAAVHTTFGLAAGDTAAGVDVEYAERATVSTASINLSSADAVVFTYVITHADGSTFTWDSSVSGAEGTTAEFAEALAKRAAVGGVYKVYFEDDDELQHLIDITVDGTDLVFTLVRGGAGNDLTVTVDDSRVEFAGSSASATDSGADILSGERLTFTLDSNPQIYEVDFTSNSLREAVDAINEAVGGAIDIASEDGNALLLTSAFAGTASSVDVVNDGAGLILFSSFSAVGAGRPNPSFYVDGEGTAHIGPHVLRNRSTGLPIDLSASGARIYFDYVALRLDVTASATDPALLTFSDVDTMDAAIGPISTENPLALACFLMLQNAPSQSVSALGVAAVNEAAPMGTTTAHLSALTFLESKDVYAIAPMTDDPFVQQLYSAHAESMSAPEERGERIVLLWQGPPTRAMDTSILAGSDARVNGSPNSITLGSTPIEGIATLGLDPADLSFDDNVYLELVVSQLGETNVYRFLVASVSGTALQLRGTFSSSENTDGFFDTPALDWTDDEDLSDLTYTLKQRGSRLLIPGTTLADRGAIAATAGAQGEAYNSRRTFMLYCGNVDTSIDGIVTPVPGYYAAAAIAGMIAELAPQQPFTRVSMTGFSKVYGTDDTFSENQLDTIADGGRYILINQGGRIASRHQRSTKSTSIEARELSITKAIDFLAKGLRATNRVYIGRYVINPGFIDQLVMSNEGYLARVVQAGVVNSAALNGVLQDSAAPDTVLIEVTVAPAYPCNKIRITIVS